MSAPVPLNLTLGNLTIGANYTPQQYAQAIVDRLTADIADGNIIFGQMGGIDPGPSPLPGANGIPGLWLNGNVIYAWNTDAAKYLPLPVTCGQLLSGAIVKSTLSCGATANRTLTTPDKDGTLALTSDIVSYLGTTTLTPAATVNVDFNLKQPAYLILGQNTTLTLSGGVDGQVQDIWIENPVAAIWTVAWPSTIVWPGGVAPTMTVAIAGHRKIDRYQLIQIGTVIYGRVLNNTAYANGAQATYDINVAGGAGADTTPPTVSSIVGKNSSFTITMSELIQSASIPTTQFSVLKNSAPITVFSAQASGNTVVVTLNGTFGSGASVTVEYTGTTIKDIAGNVVLGNVSGHFGPTHVTYGNPGSGGAQNEPS